MEKVNIENIMNKDKYITPTLEITMFTEDVIVCSNEPYANSDGINYVDGQDLFNR